MMRRADTIGVFQIESRAQMSMLPRLKPRCFYDLVIEIAIVRPGPIQGDMVHPYLRRRGGVEPVSYPSAEVRKVLERTLGVPIFQEQVMQLAIAAAGFTPGEADQLRRSMAAWRRRGGLEKFQRKLTEGMLARGYERRFADQICRQIQGFGEYGFPESHSASFALLAYVSSWLKRHHPAVFTCALLNSQPMGFYAPAQLVQDVRRHGVEVRPVDIHASGVEAALEGETGEPALRIGLNQVKGLSQAAVERIAGARGRAPFTSVGDLKRRARLHADDIEALAAADALRPLAGHRHKAFWEVAGSEAAMPLFPDPRFNEAEPLLGTPVEIQDIAADYNALGLSLRRHPVALLRDRLARRAVHTAAACRTLHDGAAATAAGLVICRQRLGVRGDLPHPGGRDGPYQRGGLAAGGGAPAPGPAAVAADGGTRHDSARAGCPAPGGGAPDGPYPVAGRAAGAVAGFLLGVRTSFVILNPEPRITNHFQSRTPYRTSPRRSPSPCPG